MSSRLQKLEQEFEEFRKQFKKEKATIAAEESRQAQHQAMIEAAQQRLPELREREEQLRVEFAAAIDALAELVDQIGQVRRDVRSAYGKPHLDVHHTVKMALVGEQQRRRMWEKIAKREHSTQVVKKQRASELRELAKDLEKQRRKMPGGGGSIDQARQRIADMRAHADRLDGKAPVPESEDSAMLITAEMALGRSFGKLKEKIKGG
jgi:hypothetical protein